MTPGTYWPVIVVLRDGGRSDAMVNVGNFIKGAVEMMILSILQHEDCYGYQLSKLIEGYSEGALVLPVGTLYPSLYRMEEQGYISFERKIIGKRLRIYYHMQNSGRDYLDKLCQEYEYVNNGIRQVLDKCSQRKE